MIPNGITKKPLMVGVANMHEGYRDDKTVRSRVQPCVDGWGDIVSPTMIGDDWPRI